MIKDAAGKSGGAALCFLAALLLNLNLHAQNKNLHEAAAFRTSVSEQDANVRRNITLACAKLNGARIKAGTIFSFNNTVGEGSSNNGFVSGRVLYRDTIVMEPGGGLCQVSSTLFNALLLAGCTIIERHRHYQPVTYVPLGLDAAIKYGKKDLRIKNPYQFDLLITAEVSDKSLVIYIKAENPLRFSYLVDTEEEETSAPFMEERGNIRQGITVEVFRKKISGSKVIESSLLYRDYYPPVYQDR